MLGFSSGCMAAASGKRFYPLRYPMQDLYITIPRKSGPCCSIQSGSLCFARVILIVTGKFPNGRILAFKSVMDFDHVTLSRQPHQKVMLFCNGQNLRRSRQGPLTSTLPYESRRIKQQIADNPCVPVKEGIFAYQILKPRSMLVLLVKLRYNLKHPRISESSFGNALSRL